MNYLGTTIDRVRPSGYYTAVLPVSGERYWTDSLPALKFAILKDFAKQGITLSRTHNTRTGERRYYANGIRISREDHQNISSGPYAKKDSLQTESTKSGVRHLCQLRITH